eukprot:snap_masked-scaffold_126-processed-gene-0.1-mRNA-1 protein AED:0.11 eAED:0.12 QI:0/0/0/0.66/1/1/3/0/333
MSDLTEIITIVVITGLVALFAFLGKGQADPFLADAADEDGKYLILYTTGEIALLIQVLVYIPSFIYQTEKFYDFTGSITYITCTIYSLLAGARSAAIAVNSDSTFEFGVKAIIASACTLLWCTRLGYFLFKRVLKVGEDSRFDAYKPNPLSFLRVWALQGLWVFLTAYCVFILNAEQNQDVSSFSDLAVLDILGLAIWVFGFGVEVIADSQKGSWRESKNKKYPFIDYGLWYYSRHPNYFGEMTLWWGIFILTLDSLRETQFAALFSPIFVFVLINYASGVPILEKRADEKFGHLDEYWEYKRTTSSLVPLPRGICGAKDAAPQELTKKDEEA